MYVEHKTRQDKGWKPTKLEGCSGGKCPRNRNSGRLAQDAAILQLLPPGWPGVDTWEKCPRNRVSGPAAQDTAILRFETAAGLMGTVAPKKGPQKAQNGHSRVTNAVCCVPKGAPSVPHRQPSRLEAQQSDPGAVWRRRGSFWATFGPLLAISGPPALPPTCVARRRGLRGGFATLSRF